MSSLPAVALAYEQLAELPLEIDHYTLAGRSLSASPEFTRHTTIITLHGGGQEGAGEDATYAPPDQVGFQQAGAVHALAGRWTFDSFSRHLATLDLFPTGPLHTDFIAFRRWAFESAALDLALRQAGLSLAEALGRTPEPTRFVVSPGPESSLVPLHERLERYPDLRFKLMPADGWDDAHVAGLAATASVDIVDLKGQYDESVPIAWPADAALYERVVEALPEALIEDPCLTPETESVLAEHRDRITWDAPIRRASDIDRLPFAPKLLNIKPSRLGTVRALLKVYGHCERAGIAPYGGGQFELGPGRGQIQTLASLFHPDAPNDVAPGAYNEPQLQDDLPQSPLAVPEPGVGFR